VIQFASLRSERFQTFHEFQKSLHRGIYLPLYEITNEVEKTFAKSLRSNDTVLFALPFSSLPFYGTAKSLPAFAMVERAIKEGKLKPEKIVVEPTSGNTGLALAEILNSLGHSFVMVVSRKISSHFEMELVRRFNAKTLELEDPSDTDSVLQFIETHNRTPFVLLVKLPINYCPTDEPTGAIAYSKRLVERGKGKILMLDQYTNSANPEIHKTVTAPSIIKGVDEYLKNGKKLFVFLSGGTFGTALGLTQFFIEKDIRVKLVIALPRGEDVFGIVDLDNAKRRRFYQELFSLLQKNAKSDLVEIVEIDKPLEKVSFMWKINEEFSKNKDLDLTGGHSSMLVLWCALEYIEQKQLNNAVCVLLFHDSSKRYDKPTETAAFEIDENVTVDETKVEKLIAEKGARLLFVDPIPSFTPKEVKATVCEKIRSRFGVTLESWQIKNIEEVIQIDERSLKEAKFKEEFLSLIAQVAPSKPIVFVCPHGGTSKILASKMRSLGYENVFSLKGGLDSF
jgi:cysteine synthase/rhodanese-related sulfurtransferase